METLCPSATFAGDFDERSWRGRVEMDAAEAPRASALLAEKAAGRATWSGPDPC